MSAATETASAEQRPKRGLLALLGANSLAISILLHILFAVGATYLIVEHFQKKHIDFHATEPPGHHTEVEHKIQMAKRNNVESAPPDLKRIVTTDVSPISLPDIPAVPQNDEITPTPISGVDGVMGSAMDSGLGGGSSGGGGGGAGSPLFGATDGNGMEGYLYDLKQTADGKPTGMTPQQYHAIIAKFVESNWSPSVLAPYYKSSKPLYATRILVPDMDAAAGPKAFGLDKEVKPNMWLIWYRGQVAAPSTGQYRFAGFCDDILLVRMKGRTILDGSIFPVTQDLPLTTPWPNKWIAGIPDIPNYGQMREGAVVTLTQGDAVDMDIVIGEEPGGTFNASLFALKADQTYPTSTSGSPFLPLFQLGTGASIPGGTHPPINDNTEPWQSVAK